MAKKAEATKRVATGSTIVQPNDCRVATGAMKRGMENKASAMK